jgi:hypothetical protein
MQRPARKTWETLAAIKDTLSRLHKHEYTQQQRAIAEATFRIAVGDLRNDMDRMAQAHGIIGRLNRYLRLLFQPRARERYHGFEQVQVWAHGDLMRLRGILDNYTRK